MSDHETDNPDTLWRALGPDMAAGYRPDPVAGGYRIASLVVYDPTPQKVRGLRFRDIERLDPDDATGAIGPAGPPEPEAIAEAWRRSQRKSAPASWADYSPETAWSDHSPETTWADLGDHDAIERANEVAEATSRENLTRKAGEAPDDFYRRVLRAHRALTMVSAKPTTELALRAGVPVGTAASWVSHAHKRLDPTTSIETGSTT